MYRRILSFNIMRYAAQRGLKKQDLAAKADVSLSYISDVTTAKGNPSLETMQAIAVALEVPLTALIEPPPVGTDGWDASLADSLRDDAKLGLPAGYQRVSAIVTDHQAFQVRKWHEAAHERFRNKR